MSLSGLPCASRPSGAFPSRGTSHAGTPGSLVRVTRAAVTQSLPTCPSGTTCSPSQQLQKTPAARITISLGLPAPLDPG